MPPRKSADEAVTPEGAAVATDTDPTEELVNDLAATQELVLRQEAMIQRLADQVDALTQSQTQTAEEAPPAPKVEDFVPPMVPEGHRRYASRYGELTMIKTAGDNMLIDGKAIRRPADSVEFTGGVFQTTEYHGPTPIPELIDWLEHHPDFNATFWVDDYAVRRQSTVEVQTGVKSTVQAAQRAPLVAPMQ